MKLTDEQIDRIAELAGALTPPSEIAALMDLDEDALLMELALPGSPAGKAFRKAKAETALDIRRREIEFARMGAPAAVQSAAAYLAGMNLD